MNDVRIKLLAAFVALAAGVGAVLVALVLARGVL